MANIKLSSVRVVSPVPFDGVSTMTLLYTRGTLEYDDEARIILATAFRASTLARSLVIPLSNVVYFEILDEKAAAAKAAALKASVSAPAPEPKPIVDDTVRLGPSTRR